MTVESMKHIAYIIYKPCLAIVYFFLLLKGCQYIGPSHEASERHLNVTE